jgi:DNA ligase (NAD+)
MPCDFNCKHHLKARANGIVAGHRLMIGEVFCLKEKRKLSAQEASSPSAPMWCPAKDAKTVVPVKSKKPAKAPVSTAAAVPPKPNVGSAVASPQKPAAYTGQISRKMGRVHELVALLNKYRDEYYNKNAPSVDDAVYDRLFVELRQLEQDTGYIMSNSPTQTVGFKPVSKLEKTTHAIPLLSLDDTKDINGILAFAGAHPVLLMHKLDGLTMKLEYEDGELIRASTRGDGNEGEVVTHNSPAISGIPQRIPYRKRLIVVGEAFIHNSDFEFIKQTLVDSSGKPYKNARNLAAGSVRSHDPAECVKRLVHFTPFNVQEDLDEDAVMANSKFAKLNHLKEFGFSECGCFLITKPTLSVLEGAAEELRKTAAEGDVPIDGLVCTYVDIEFSKSCGSTGHHYKDGYALKFEDDLHQTVFRSIEWTPTRTGELSMVALFDTVVIDGCDVSRATLHNLTIIRELELTPGCRILVSKRNMIIPHVEDNLDRGKFSDAIFPQSCPCCGQPTRIQTSKSDGRDVETLHCDNTECDSQRLRQFVHFVCKKAMNIEGLSKATLKRFIEYGWLDSFKDIYRLDRYKENIVLLDGFGEKSYDRLWDAIQTSRNTTFDRYLISMDIPMVGRTASGIFSRQFGGSLDAFEAAVDSRHDFTQLPGIGMTLHQNIHAWFKVEENRNLWKELQKLMSIQNPTVPGVPAASSDSVFTGKTMVATGKFESFSSREAINAAFVSLGATVGSSVTKNTNYLVYGGKPGSKLDKARSMGVTILSEQKFREMSGMA